jgi:acyl-CoA reductase-like NAD-dependent aldehyde dehydrogenase
VSYPDIDRALLDLTARKQIWADTSIPQRIELLQKCLTATVKIAPEWTNAACIAKGIDPDCNLAGEEYIAGAIAVVRHLRLLIETLTANAQLPPPQLSQRENGQIVAQVLPANLLDRLLWFGYRGEVWLEPGKPATQGQIYRQPTPGQLALVLGAGNVSAIGAMDTLYQLFAANRVVILKTNPVNAYLGEYLAQAFAPLIEAGYLRIVDGGADIGDYLCHHPQVDTIHITGSHHTHDAIVWGATASERQQRKADDNPKLTKPITSELGCVTPILVVPGNWSTADLTFQARQVAAAIAHNASFNCAAAQILVTASGWAQREEFLDLLRRELTHTPPRQAYYPGSQERYQSFLDRYPQTELLGTRTESVIPWTLIPDLPPSAGEYALTEEAFCGLLAEVQIPATTAPEFLTTAVNFANEKLWGSLSCTLLIDRNTQRKYQQELHTAIADLKYGTIGVNIWSGATFYVGSTTWGAYPGNSLDNIGSGMGIVHNTYLFDYPQKSVFYAPFRIFPTPLWFAKHRSLLPLAKELLKFEAAPSWTNLITVAIAAMQS